MSNQTPISPNSTVGTIFPHANDWMPSTTNHQATRSSLHHSQKNWSLSRSPRFARRSIATIPRLEGRGPHHFFATGCKPKRSCKAEKYSGLACPLNRIGTAWESVTMPFGLWKFQVCPSHASYSNVILLENTFYDIIKTYSNRTLLRRCFRITLVFPLWPISIDKRDIVTTHVLSTSDRRVRLTWPDCMVLHDRPGDARFEPPNKKDCLVGVPTL